MPRTTLLTADIWNNSLMLLYTGLQQVALVTGLWINKRKTVSQKPSQTEQQLIMWMVMLLQLVQCRKFALSESCNLKV